MKLLRAVFTTFIYFRVGLWKHIKLIFWKIWFVSKKTSINKRVMPRFLLSALSLSSQGSKSLFVQARCMSSQSKICALIVGKFYKNYCIETIRIVRDLIPKLNSISSFNGPCGNRDLIILHGSELCHFSFTKKFNLNFSWQIFGFFVQISMAKSKKFRENNMS